MKKIILILSAAILLLTSCQNDADVVAEFKPAATAQNQAKIAAPNILATSFSVVEGRYRMVHVTFNQTTANFYQGTLYMHIKVNSVWTFDILPSPWNNPVGVYQVSNTLPSGNYDIFFSTNPLPLFGSASPTYNISL